MKQFYIGDDDADGIRRCTESQLEGTSITISGMTADGQVQEYTGVVQSFVQDATRDPDRRWRVTIYGGEPLALGSKRTNEPTDRDGL